MTTFLIILIVINLLLAVMYINMWHQFDKMRKILCALSIAFLVEHEKGCEDDAEACKELRNRAEKET